MGVKLNSSGGGSVEINPPSTGSTFTLTAPAITDTIVTKTSTDTLTNKTLTSPTITSPTITSPTITGASMSSMSSSVLTQMSANNGAATIVGSTTVPFTGIPSWVKRLTVISYGLSTNSTSPVILQLGTSGGWQTSGYAGMAQYGSSASYVTGTNLTGMYPFNGNNAGNSGNFIMILYLLDSTSNKWVTSGVAGDAAGLSLSSQFAWGVTLSGTLTQVRWNTVNGTDTFDAGTVNVMYE